ncbi:MAG: hypothetical protein HY360_01020 [Verrucomicrobia bacterium]|nr:hypothetical protein [Verrucomicrobiota bacterium]
MSLSCVILSSVSPSVLSIDGKPAALTVHPSSPTLPPSLFLEPTPCPTRTRFFILRREVKTWRDGEKVEVKEDIS